MKSDIMISIIVPVYNVEKYIASCLISLQKQSYNNFEVICVDDCSTDKSWSILEDFSKKDNRIKIFKNETNEGPGYCRNKGLTHAIGEYIIYLDSDDYLSFNALELLYYNSKINNSDIVIYKLARFSDLDFNFNTPAFDFSECFDINTDFNKFTFNYKEIKKHVLNSSFSPCLKFYKRTFLIDNNIFFPTSIKIGEDVPVHVKVLLCASEISFVPEFLYNYRLSNLSSSTHNQGYFKDVFIMCELVENILREHDSFDEFKKEFYLFKIQQILQYLNKTSSSEYFSMAKNEFEKINDILLKENESLKNFLRESLANQWNYYENMLISKSNEEYLTKLKMHQ